MNAQIIETPEGNRMVVIPEADYHALLEAAEDSIDREAVREFRAAHAAGLEELVPASVVKRVLDGENPIRVWREHRGLTAKALAHRAGLGAGYLSQVETGRRAGTLVTLRKIASALDVAIDDLVPPHSDR